VKQVLSQMERGAAVYAEDHPNLLYSRNLEAVPMPASFVDREIYHLFLGQSGTIDNPAKIKVAFSALR
jgi:hypothetical protein